MKAIIRREILNYLKRPLFWMTLIVVIVGVFSDLKPYLKIHYITSGEVQSDDPEISYDGEIYDGYVPSSEEEHRKIWENAIQKSLTADFAMSNDEASAVIQEMSSMEIEEACRYLEEQYGYYGAEITYENAAYHKGTMEEINTYLQSKLAEHPFSYYFSKKFADFSGLYMGFAATILLAVLFMQDMRKNTYELLHTKPITARQYILGKVFGGFLIIVMILGILNLVFWGACVICTRGNGFEIRLTDFLSATCLYILPNMLMIVCVYTIVSLLFKNPLPAAPFLVLYLIYSNIGSRNAEGVYVYSVRPLAIMVRFPGMFFDVAVPPMVMINQIFLLFASAVIILVGIQLWRRRRI